MKYKISEVGEIEIKNIVLDLNGTLSVKGKITKKAEDKIKELNEKGFNIILFTGDQRGTAEQLCGKLGINFMKCKSSDEKAKAMKNFKKDETASIGNARIDIGTFENSRISIATLQSEGIHTEILKYVDIIVPSIEDAFDLFLDKNNLGATMRK